VFELKFILKILPCYARVGAGARAVTAYRLFGSGTLLFVIFYAVLEKNSSYFSLDHVMQECNKKFRYKICRKELKILRQNDLVSLHIDIFNPVRIRLIKIKNKIRCLNLS
jgi:hypothetical protein